MSGIRQTHDVISILVIGKFGLIFLHESMQSLTGAAEDSVLLLSRCVCVFVGYVCGSIRGRSRPNIHPTDPPSEIQTHVDTPTAIFQGSCLVTYLLNQAIKVVLWCQKREHDCQPLEYSASYWLWIFWQFCNLQNALNLIEQIDAENGLRKKTIPEPSCMVILLFVTNAQQVGTQQGLKHRKDISLAVYLPCPDDWQPMQA